GSAARHEPRRPPRDPLDAPDADGRGALRPGGDDRPRPPGPLRRSPGDPPRPGRNARGDLRPHGARRSGWRGRRRGRRRRAGRRRCPGRMNRIGVVTEREFLSTVRRTSYLIVTFGMPFFAALYFGLFALVPAYVMS